MLFNIPSAVSEFATFHLLGFLLALSVVTVFVQLLPMFHLNHVNNLL